MGKERIDEVFNPKLVVNRAVDYYRTKGYNDKWIKAKLTGVVDRRKLTDVMERKLYKKIINGNNKLRF